MSNAPAIFLLTDFGTTDSYVGIMKAVITGIAPDSAIHDLNHHVRPQDVRHGAFELLISYPYLPNGAIVCISLDNQNYWFNAPKHVVSHTFHGRDIFSPVAAHIAAGIPLNELGSTLTNSEPVTLDFPKVQEDSDKYIAQIIHIDTFGNLITNFRGHNLTKDTSEYAVHIKNTVIPGISKNFTDVENGASVTYIGSSGFLEIAIRNGSAYKHYYNQNFDSLSKITISSGNK